MTHANACEVSSRGIVRRHFRLGVALLAFLAPAFGQFTAVLEGYVTDPSDAAIPGAEVVVENQATGVKRNAKTSESGYFRVPSLPSGLFTVRISAAGFETTVQENVLLQSDQVKTINVQLKVGAPTTQVTVEAAVPLIETGEAKVSGHIQQRQVAQLPLVGRNFMTLVVLTPGVTGLPAGGGQAYAQATGDIFAAEYGVNLNANGQRAESNSFLVDNTSVNASPRGGVTNYSPNADSVQELRVSVNNFSAEYGRNSSAMVNVITKSGTNEYHGTVGWFHTNNRLTGRNGRFQPRVPVFRRNEYNGSIGGPILKNRLFGFGSFDILRSGLGQGFSAGAVTPELIDYASRRFPTNISTRVMKEFPNQLVKLSDGLFAGPLAGAVPNVGACSSLPEGPATPVDTPIGRLPCNFPLTFNGTFAQTLPRDGEQWNFRIDYVFNEGKDRIYGSAAKTNLSQVAFGSPSVYPAFTQPGTEYTAYFNLNYTHVFSPTVLNEFSFGGTRARGDVPVMHGYIPQLNVPGIASYGNGFSDATFIQNNREWRNVTSINRGAHAFKFGGIIQRTVQPALFGNVFTRPYYSFTNLFDFILDDPFSQSNIGFNPQTGELKGIDFRPIFGGHGLFIQDDWKVRPNLTLSLGLRWEVYWNPDEVDNLFVGATFPKGATFLERIANMKPVQKRPLDAVDYNNFAPRIGIAWDPTRRGKMSVRAGFGVFYDRPAGQFYRDAQTSLPLFGLASVSKQTEVKPVYGLSSSTTKPWKFPLPVLRIGLDERNGLIGVPATSTVWDPHLRNQYSFNWFFGIQYSLTNDWAVEANYVGSAGRKLYMVYDVNRFSGDLFDGLLNRLNSSFADIQYGQALGTSHYEGGNVSLRKRYGSGLDLQVAYTFGKAIDTASSFGINLPVVDIFNLNLQKGRSDFDVRHKLAMSLLYSLPSPAGSGALRRVFGNWEVGAVTILQSGPPFHVICTLPFRPVRDAAGNIIRNDGCDFNADGFNNDRLDAPAFSKRSGWSREEWLNGIFRVSDFPKPAPGRPGTLGRNVFTGPGFANTNLNVIRRFPAPFLGEKGNIDFRAEFFNLFNRLNLNPQGIVTNIADPSRFGQVTSALGARNVQFGLKILF